MSWTNTTGEAMGRPEPRRLRVDPERMIDLLIVKSHALGVPWRAIGPMVRLSHEGARKRFLAIPEPVRANYCRAALG